MEPKKKSNVEHYHAKSLRGWQVRKFIRIAIIFGLLFIGTLLYFYLKNNAAI